MGSKARYFYHFVGGALAGAGAGAAIQPNAGNLQFVLALAFGLGLAKINQSMDRDAKFPQSGRNWRVRLGYFTGAGLGKRGALQLIFASLAFVAVFWFARDATEHYASEWFGYDTREFVEDRWPIVIGVLAALLGGYRYMANDIETPSPAPQ
ncbi:hypothetical protein [Sphingobium sp. Leaf26]|uniref:hypothetical protein n=1 Tax=Sphingobium sp. Leaf26 TaxID=1735693 RepID=UPI0012E22091|nr:hypothetical protein [Sphingobium sp. Leaf26]